MRVLWLCSIMLPQIAENIGCAFRSTNGWLDILSRTMAKDPQMELTVLFPVDKRENKIAGRIERMHYESFFTDTKRPEKYCKNQEDHFTEVLMGIRPEIIHIWGSEYPYTLAMVKSCENLGIASKVIINIQGLISVCAYHYYAGLPYDIIGKKTFRDLIKRDGFVEAKEKFTIRGKYEVQALEKVKHVIGRTEWDKVCIKALNPQLAYYPCNEILRKSFYKNSWELSNCNRYTIFVSQWGYPIKGFHQILEALKEVKKKYPDVHLVTTGENPFDADIKKRLRQNYYCRYLMELIEKWGLKEHVTFLGKELKEEEMKREYIKAHVFVLPSVVENSPNSLGEAMLLGTPAIASNVGGVNSLLTHGKEGYLYPFDEPYMLAYYIEKIFEDDTLACKFSQAEKERAMRTHHIESNIEAYMEIYKDICSGNSNT